MDDVVELRTTATAGLKLVRPDGYIALQANDSNVAIGNIRSLLHKMTAFSREH